MGEMKSAAGETALGYLGYTGSLGRPLSEVLRPHRRVLIISGLLSLPLIILSALAPGWMSSSVEPSPQPLNGKWDCSLAGEPLGPLSINGWNYVLGPDTAGERGTLEPVVYPGKYHEEIIKVHSGMLNEKFGVKLGFHFHLAAQPEMLVFNIAPGAGIRCTRR